MTSFIIPGPNGPDSGAGGHHGRFRVCDFGEHAGFVSLGVKVSASLSCSVSLFARWSRWDEATGVFVDLGAPTLAHGPSDVGDDTGEFSLVSSIFLHVPALAGATHWQPEVRLYAVRPVDEEDAGTPLAPGDRVRFDNIFVPDNGYPINTRPYLDGDQTGAKWEGTPHASTSVYGTPLPPPSPPPTPEEEMLAPPGPPDPAPSTQTDLDDDLNL